MIVKLGSLQVMISSIWSILRELEVVVHCYCEAAQQVKDWKTDLEFSINEEIVGGKLY